MQHYRELEVYKVCKNLSVLVHSHSADWPKSQQFALTSQIQRASISVVSNLAEGFGRFSSKDTCHFIAMARGSCYEVEAQIDLALALGYTSTEQFDEVQACIDLTKKLLNGVYKRYDTLASNNQQLKTNN